MIKRDIVIFDLGNVLIDFDPRHVYKEHFGENKKAFHDFFDNRAMWDILDHGHNSLESWDTSFNSLIAERPELKKEIDIFRRDWFKFVLGPMQESVKIFQRLHKQNVALYALTNWPAQGWPPQSHPDSDKQHNYDFLDNFKDIVVSGVEQMRKPDAAFYQLALERWQVNPERCVFVDDHPENVATANDLGIYGHHFTSAANLESDLQSLGLLGAPR